VPVRHPIQYEIKPRTVNAGTNWLTLTLKNVGQETLTDLDVRLNSIDTYAMLVRGMGDFVSQLEPGEEETLSFQVAVESSGSVYVSVDGHTDGARFHWESPNVRIEVGTRPAEVVDFFALTEPRVQLGEPIACRATVRSLIKTVNLVLEFWVEKPDGEQVSLDKEGLGTLDRDQVIRRTVEFTPKQEGIYILHAYLYQGAQRLDHAIDYLSISLM